MHPQDPVLVKIIQVLQDLITLLILKYQYYWVKLLVYRIARRHML